MIISILNCDKYYGIGKKNGLLFSLPLDMKFFREKTSGHVVAMGENTLISFPSSKPLKNRINIVLSKDESHNYNGCINVHDFSEFVKTIIDYSINDDVYIIGGASIYKQMLPFVDYVYLTKVNADGGAEVFFENIDSNPNFIIENESEPLLDNGYEIKFVTYKNINKQTI